MLFSRTPSLVPTIALATTPPPAVANASAVGTGALAARNDHTHAAIVTAINQAYDFAGGLVDYTSDPNFTLGASTPVGSYEASGTLGDGVHVPRFWCHHHNAPSGVKTLQRTTTNSLRIGPADSLAGTDAFPFSVTGASIIIPLPDYVQLTIDFILSTNVGVGALDGAADRGFVAVGGYTSANAFFNVAEVGFVYNVGASAIYESYVGPEATSSRGTETSAAVDPAFKSGGVVATRRYQFVLDGGVVSILGAPTSGPLTTPSVALVQANDASFLPIDARRYLALSVAAGSGGTRNFYAEFQANLSWTGVRSFS